MYPVLVSLSANYSRHQGRLFTRYSPVRHSTGNPKIPFAFDLHVLSTPPAFVLSQDQTLQFNILNPIAVLQIDSIGFYSTTIKYYRPARLLFSFQRSKLPTRKWVPPHDGQVIFLLFISDRVKFFCQKVKHRLSCSAKQRGGNLFDPGGEVNDIFFFWNVFPV